MLKKFIILMMLIGVGILVWLFILYSEIRHNVDKMVNYNPVLTTQFFDRNNKLIANIFKDENRLYVKYEDIPPQIVQSLIAIEDTQFFEHNGVNLDAILRAIITDLKHMKFVEGASTLTQQLVKTTVLTRDKKIMRKIKEILLSLRLETLLSKEEILERYLNQVYFGHGYYGIKTAALGYFHKKLHELNPKEIAILVGLPKAPSFYDPTKNLKFSLSRANQVIRRLDKLSWINKTQYEEAINFIPIVYDDTLTLNKAPYIVDAAVKELQDKIKGLRTKGYKINLTIDLEAQEIARDALALGYENALKRDKYIDTNKSKTKTLNGAIINIESNTGRILSMVGGVNYKKSSFNRVTQSKRQPGSAAKPFIYQTALDLGYSTMSELVDISRTYDYNNGQKDKNGKAKKWKPSNYEHTFKGLISLKQALVHSRNLATINLANDIGVDEIYKTLAKYGFTNIPMDLSITLGSFSISPYDMSHMFTVFSNKGVQVKPYLIESIVSNDFKVIKFEAEKRVMSDASQIYLMTDILKNVVSSGTGRRARVKGIEIAGKTGTTNNNKDAWFCGYSPTIQTIVWFGNDDNKPMGRRETGGTTAGPVFSYFYKHWMELHPEIPRKFKKPHDVRVNKFNGKKEYFTRISPMPMIEKISNINSNAEEESVEF